MRFYGGFSMSSPIDKNFVKTPEYQKLARQKVGKSGFRSVNVGDVLKALQPKAALGKILAQVQGLY